MKTFEFYTVLECYDRDCQKVASFTNETDAVKLIKTSPYYSSKPSKNSIMVFESYSEYEEWKSGEVKRNALSKLTKEEKIVLGLE
jgi:hypothetical protein